MILEEEEEEIKEMVGGNFNINEYISNDMWFEILLRLPAQDIHFGARRVVREWNHMTRTNFFVQKHLEHSSYGLLIHTHINETVFVSARDDGGIETYKMNYESLDPCMPIWSGNCNGLMLEIEPNLGKHIYYVRNVSTCQALRLPTFPYYAGPIGLSAIGYDAASMRYKVVVSFLKSEKFECVILTVGVDKSWRSVCTDHLSVVGRATLFDCPIITEGFAHWIRLVTTSTSTYMVTLNLETEIFTETLLPLILPIVEKDRECYSLTTGRCLSFFIKRGNLTWEVLEMKPKTGEWRKLANICLDGEKERIEGLGFKFDDVAIRPRCWLKYPDVLALNIESVSIIFYNLVTREIGTEKLSTDFPYYQVTLHKNSLVWF